MKFLFSAVITALVLLTSANLSAQDYRVGQIYEGYIIKNDGFIFFTTDATFINNSTYRLKVVDNTQGLVIFRAKVFATNQIKQNYSING